MVKASIVQEKNAFLDFAYELNLKGLHNEGNAEPQIKRNKTFQLKNNDTQI